MQSPPVQSTRTVISQDYKVVRFDRPLTWTRSEDEVWMFNPPRQYILNANQLQSEQLKPFIEQVSDLRSTRDYRPLSVAAQLRRSRLLVERFRDRGIGDMLFMTGPLSYIQHVTGGTTHIDMYGLVDRSTILTHHPALSYGCVMAGPILYDDLRHYAYHWFVDSVTEHVETKDQLNVYDALFKQIGLDPAKVDPRFKRPSMTLVKKDFEDLDSLYYMIARERSIDLRIVPYYVLAPTAVSTLRLAPYSMWLKLAETLSRARPVFIVGNVAGDGRMPSAGMSFGQFYQATNNLGPRVINVMGNTSLRVVAALLSKSIAAVTLDSGLLYVAQALNVPTVSLWGTHAPHTRIGYDQAYMRNAIFKKGSCPNAPCYAYATFPHDRCVRGAQQTLCEPLIAVDPMEIIDKITEIEQSVGGSKLLKRDNFPPAPVESAEVATA